MHVRTTPAFPRPHTIFQLKLLLGELIIGREYANAGDALLKWQKFFPLVRTSEKQHCDKGESGGGRKNSGRRNQCLLTWTAKEFNYTGRIFLPLLRVCESQGEEDRPFGRARGEFHFRVPHEDDGPLPSPLSTTVAGSKKKRVLVRSCHLRRSPRFCEG